MANVCTSVYLRGIKWSAVAKCMDIDYLILVLACSPYLLPCRHLQRP